MAGVRAAAGALLAAAAGLAGCNGGGSAYVTQFPRWDFERYERIAVLPATAADPKARRDAEVLTDRLTTLLAQSGEFRVLSRAELASVFKEQDLARLADAVDAGTALPEGRVEVAQALVAAKITDYRLIDERERLAVPRYAYDRRGRVRVDGAGRPIVVGEDVVWVYRHGAEVEGSVRVIDAATGAILLSHSDRVVPRARSRRGRPPDVSPQELATEAARELAVAFYKSVAPTRIRVKLKGDMLIVATDYYDGRYAKAKSIPRSRAEFLVVVRDLPEECERNRFRVALAPKDGRRNLLEEEFTWSGGSGPEGVSFRVPVAALVEAGGQEFVAKLYSVGTPEPILERSFKLAEAGEKGGGAPREAQRRMADDDGDDDDDDDDDNDDDGPEDDEGEDDDEEDDD